MGSYKLLINGRLVEGERSIDVINPATEKELSACPCASEAQLNEAVAAAKAAFSSWSALPIEARKAKVNEIADALENNKEELASILTQEQGKPLGDSIGEIDFTAFLLRQVAEQDLPVEVFDDSEGRRVEGHRMPLGVVAGIVPWNFPISLAGFKIAPALVAGNTLVLKPAATTPLSTLKIAELIQNVVPPGVVNVIADANDLGGLLCQHPDVKKISFTGSTATGAKVLGGAAHDIKRVTLELGGNDAGIVLADADPKKVAPELFASAFNNCGQVCIAIKRLYVHESIYDEICDELAAIAKAKRVGDGMQEGTDIGPLQNKTQYEKVKGIISEAAEQGTVIAGGECPDGPGYFISPTLVRDISEGSRLVDEEQFGPVLPIIKFSDEDDVIARANGTNQGLAGSVWSASVEHAYEVAKRVVTGTIWVNKHTEVDPGIPFGGAKQSGLGAELGQSGLNAYTQLKIINIAT